MVFVVTPFVFCNSSSFSSGFQPFFLKMAFYNIPNLHAAKFYFSYGVYGVLDERIMIILIWRNLFLKLFGFPLEFRCLGAFSFPRLIFRWYKKQQLGQNLYWIMSRILILLRTWFFFSNLCISRLNWDFIYSIHIFSEKVNLSRLYLAI